MNADSRVTSRKEWTVESTHEGINVGSLQRIADACEKMAQSYDAMRESRDSYQRWYNDQRERSNRLELRIRALKGVITRLKRS